MGGGLCLHEGFRLSHFISPLRYLRHVLKQIIRLVSYMLHFRLPFLSFNISSLYYSEYNLLLVAALLDKQWA